MTLAVDRAVKHQHKQTIFLPADKVNCIFQLLIVMNPEDFYLTSVVLFVQEPAITGEHRLENYRRTVTNHAWQGVSVLLIKSYRMDGVLAKQTVRKRMYESS